MPKSPAFRVLVLLSEALLVVSKPSMMMGHGQLRNDVDLLVTFAMPPRSPPARLAKAHLAAVQQHFALVGGEHPCRMLSIVDLPAPFSPISAWIPPPGCRRRRRRALLAWNTLVTCWNSIKFSICTSFLSINAAESAPRALNKSGRIAQRRAEPGRNTRRRQQGCLDRYDARPEPQSSGRARRDFYSANLKPVQPISVASS